MKLQGNTNLFGSFCISVILAVLGITLSKPALADWFSTPLSQREMCTLYNLHPACSHNRLASAISAMHGKAYGLQPRFGFVEFSVTQTRTGGEIKKIRWIDDGQLPANRSPLAFNFNLALRDRYGMNWERYAKIKLYSRPTIALAYNRSWLAETDAHLALSGQARDKKISGLYKKGGKISYQNKLDVLYIPFSQKESGEVFGLAWDTLTPNPVTGRPEFGLSLTF